MARRRRRFPAGLGTLLVLVAVTVILSGAAVMLVRGRGGFAYDVLIRNAEVYDGSGGEPFHATVAVSGRRVAAVWREEPFMRPVAPLEIDAGGSALAPGFVDTHSHADFAIGDGASPIRADNFLMQGVTTMIVGNCGRLNHDVRFLSSVVDKRRSNVNLATLVGLNSVRERVMPKSTAPATGAQIAVLSSLVRDGMEAGALGVSTGYAYLPGRFMSEREIVAQLAVARKYDGVHASHVRDEAHGVTAAVDEAMRASEKARIPLLVSHLKIAGRSNCGQFEALRARLTSFQRSVGPLFVDQYPFDAQSTGLDLYLPDEFLKHPQREQARQLIATPGAVKNLIRARLRAEGYDDLSFARVANYAPRPSWRGLTIDEIDRRLRNSTSSTLDTQLDVVLEMLRHGGAQMIYHNLCDDVLTRVQQDPLLVSMFGSDSTIRYNDGKSFPHPRGWNTFPRAFREIVFRRRALSVAEAVRRMTDVPARFFGLEDRGRIAPGYFADLVLFDPKKLDGADFTDPFRRPTGIRYVFVNGTVAVAEQSRGILNRRVEVATTGAAPGVFIKREARLRRLADGLMSTCRLPAGDERPAAQAPLLARLVDGGRAAQAASAAGITGTTGVGAGPRRWWWPFSDGEKDNSNDSDSTRGPAGEK